MKNVFETTPHNEMKCVLSMKESMITRPKGLDRSARLNLDPDRGDKVAG